MMGEQEAGPSAVAEAPSLRLRQTDDGSERRQSHLRTIVVQPNAKVVERPVSRAVIKDTAGHNDVFGLHLRY
jgi:hypothetical protein